jgi:dTMP kinase
VSEHLDETRSREGKFDNDRCLFQNRAVPRLPFITFEGSEGCGKSTQVQRLANRLNSLGVPTFITREPGGTPIGETIKELLQFAPHNSAMTPETELLLFEASRAQLVRETIHPALSGGMCVISDRFFDSTTVYQGVARRLDAKWVEELNRFAVGDCIPDLTLVLDVDVNKAGARMLRRVRTVTEDRMEREPIEFYQAVRDAYRALAKEDPGRFVLIDGDQSMDDIEMKIWDVVSSRFPQLAGAKI